MKRALQILTIILFVGVVPCTAASVTESDIIGAWTTTSTSIYGEPVVISYYFLADHRAFLASCRLAADGTTSSGSSSGIWELHDDYIYYIYSDSMNGTRYLHLEDCFFKEKAGGGEYHIYGKVPTETALPDGVQVPQGEYSVGDDIPSGKYTIDAGAAPLVTVWTYPKSGIPEFYYIGTKQSSGSVVVNLKDGGRIRVDGGTVYLRKFSGLDLTGIEP